MLGAHPLATVRPDLLCVVDLAPAQARRWGLHVLSPRRDGAALVLKTVVDHLRTGGLALLVLGGDADQATAEVPFFGGSLPVPRSIATMARHGRAVIIPITTAWALGGASIRVTVHPPLELDKHAADQHGAERELLGRLLATFEAAARAAPEEGDRRLLEVSGQARRAGAATAPAS
jgi:lauroyl/myristoyl acyltransferase